ncbi:MAG: DUF1127 domain-containing protein [Aeromonadaceae bacterium]
MERLNPGLNESARRVILAFLRNAWRGFRHRCQRRQEMRYLAQMSDHQLRDIGLTLGARTAAPLRYD